jgi:hypothetical protein
MWSPCAGATAAYLTVLDGVTLEGLMPGNRADGDSGATVKSIPLRAQQP